LLVPPEAAGACELRVGGGAARRWAEGAVLLFDDSFEHEVLVWGGHRAAMLICKEAVVFCWAHLIKCRRERERERVYIGELQSPLYYFKQFSLYLASS
jgi:hypothetical protein